MFILPIHPNFIVLIPLFLRLAEPNQVGTHYLYSIGSQR